MKGIFLRKFTKDVQVISNLFEGFDAASKLIDPECYLVILGGIRGPADIPPAADLLRKQAGNYVLSKSDVHYILNVNEETNTDVLEFLENQFTFTHIEYVNRSGFTFLYGGIPPEIKSWEDMKNSVEICVTDEIKVKGVRQSWHRSYSGAFGYVCSYNPVHDDASDGITLIDFKRHSCSTGNLSNKTNILRFNQHGIVNVVWPK